MVRTFLVTLIVLLGWLVAADVAGVGACLILDIAPLRHGSGGISYAIWFALGVFAGFLAFGTAGAFVSPAGDETWMERPGARAIGNRVLVSSLVILLALCAFFYWLYWSRGVAGDYFVPDSAPHTATFVIAVVTGMLFGRSLTAPKSR